MKFKYKLLKESFQIAFKEKLGVGVAVDDEDFDGELVDCSEVRFSNALFIVKRYLYENRICQAHSMDTDRFDLRWGVIFGDLKQAPRERVKNAIEIAVTSMYGLEVVQGMKPKEFNPFLAMCFMNCVADLSDKIRFERDLLNEVFNRALEIYQNLEKKEKMELVLQEKAKSPTVKI
jgi:hypothetical protein